MTWESTPAPRYGNRPLAGEFRGVGLGGAISAFSAWRRGELAEGLREQLGEFLNLAELVGHAFARPAAYCLRRSEACRRRDGLMGFMGS